jgi:hypothetical protein
MNSEGHGVTDLYHPLTWETSSVPAATGREMDQPGRSGDAAPATTCEVCRLGKDKP